MEKRHPLLNLNGKKVDPFQLSMESTLSVLRDELMAIYPTVMNQETVEEFSRHCCKLIETRKKFILKDILVREELEKISKNCLDVSSID